MLPDLTINYRQMKNYELKIKTGAYIRYNRRILRRSSSSVEETQEIAFDTL